jgi:hypothetical protein
MKDEIKKILQDYMLTDLPLNDATQRVLDLFAVMKSLPTDEKIQKWGEDYADELFNRSDNPLSEWWINAETFTNGGRAVIRHIEGNVS